jgi:hypothetical protein
VTATDVFNACSAQFPSDWNTGKLSYQGGGSRVGAGNMDNDLQAVSPMSSALKGAEYCSPQTSGGVASSVYTSPAAPASAGLTAGLLVGLDGVAITANQVMSCSASSANGIGLATSSPMVVTAGGTPVAQGGTQTGTYTFGDSGGAIFQGQPSFDALAVLYFGLTHDKQYSGCASDIRKSLIKNWHNLFSSDCTGGANTCTAGLTHAWRRSDLSGTTDAFVSILNPPGGTASNGKGATVSVGIGSLPQYLSKTTFTGVAPDYTGGTGTSTAPGAGVKSNPFCNSVDANYNILQPPYVVLASAPQTPGGSSDFSDQDPVRTPCVKGVDAVCEGFLNQANSGGAKAGDLGVVLPILIPDGTSVQPIDRFPQTNCSAACAPMPAFKGNKSSLYPGFLCPSGAPPIGGNQCWMPYTGSDSSPNFQCNALNTDKCGDIVGGNPDGRRYNLVTVVPSSQLANIPGGFNTGNYQFAVDASLPVPRMLTGSFHKIHSIVAGQNYAAGVGTETGTTGICQENDDTSQIGCLTDSDPCSIGYAGRESDKGYPGKTPQPLKGLAVNGITPFTPAGTATCVPTSALSPGTACTSTNGTLGTTSDANFGIEALVGTPGTTPLYPLSRRLYFATIYGFQNLQGRENELAECYGTTSIMSSAMTNNGFVPVPTGVVCEDYPQDVATTVSPAANVQGPGNVALTGCGTSNVDACKGATAGTAAAHDVNGNNVLELDTAGNTVTY